MIHKNRDAKTPLIVGVDQTGARWGKHKARPLPFALLEPQTDSWVAHFSDDFFIESFHRNCINTSIGQILQTNVNHWNIFVVVDCVLGLPSKFQTSRQPLQDLKKQILKAGETSEYGLSAGDIFFTKLLGKKRGSELPKRKVEQSVGANSVFANQPRQRNIQTGTFRIWKDLASDKEFENIGFFPFQPARFTEKKTTIVCEGYPSLAWKLLNQSQRSEKELSPILSRFQSIVINMECLKSLESPDHRDAAFLALLALDLIGNDGLEYQCSDIEGGILGDNNP